MIIKDSDAAKRLDNPMNLINQLRCGNGNKKNNAMKLFGIGKKKEENKEIIEITKLIFNPFKIEESLSSSVPTLTPTQVPAITKLDNILENHEAQIKLGLAHDRALDLLNSSVALLSAKLEDVSAAKLPSVISAASKTVESIRRERTANRANGNEREVHYHFYTPEQRKVSDYEVIDVV